jgi:hypothetical protein
MDAALNRLDASPRLRREGAPLYAALTSGVVNSEDDLLQPDKLRERLTILQGVIALSQGPPTPAQLGESAAIRTQFDAAMKAYHEFLAAHHLPPDPKPEVCHD